MTVHGAGAGKGRPKEATNPCSLQKHRLQWAHEIVLSSVKLNGQSQPHRWAQAAQFSLPSQECICETPRGETEARHPGEVGGWQFRGLPGSASPIRHWAGPWAPGQKRAGKSYTPTFWQVWQKGGREAPLLSFSPRRAVLPKPPLHWQSKKRT